MPAAAPSTAYRPRHPERSDFYKIFEQHFERYLSVYDEGFVNLFRPGQGGASARSSDRASL